MQLTLYEDSILFERKVLPDLLKKEDVHSLFLGVLQDIKAGRYKNPMMATVEKNGQLLAFFQMTPPHPLNFVVLEEAHFDEITRFFLKEMQDRKISFSSIIGLSSWAYRFAELKEQFESVRSVLMMDQGIYRIKQVNEKLLASPGSWRYARLDDAALIEQWFTLFEEDAGLPITPLEKVKERVAVFLQHKEIFLWEDAGTVVSMMKKARPTQNGITVSLVYTPKSHRKQGYARTLVATITKYLLKEYRFCVLYTDLMNPTSNKIYQEVGYEKIAESAHLSFIPRSSIHEN